jgi:undecaprenyl-diphosphatase
MSRPETSQRVKSGFLPAAGIGVIAAVSLFLAWFSEEMLKGDTVQFDATLRAAIHKLASPTLTQAMVAFSFLGSTVLISTLSVLAALLFLYFRMRREAVLIAIIVAGSYALEIGLKHAFHRARPAAFFGDVPSSYSFPSGHAMVSFCFYGALAILISTHVPPGAGRWLIWGTAILLIALIGISRIYLGVHYPSDVVAGYSAGSIWMATMWTADKIWATRASPRPESTENAGKRT